MIINHQVEHLAGDMRSSRVTLPAHGDNWEKREEEKKKTCYNLPGTVQMRARLWPNLFGTRVWRRATIGVTCVCLTITDYYYTPRLSK